MNPREKGFLLLTGCLGDPDRKPLTVAQFRELTKRARQMEKPTEVRDLNEGDLLRIGCDPCFATRILKLLSDEEQLDWYVETGSKKACYPVSRLGENYPQRLRDKLALDAPACLWAKGDLGVLNRPMVALVGSRDLDEANKAFAKEVGKQAALRGYALVSGNARGADQVAQDSCLQHGGYVVSFLADELWNKAENEKVLYLSDDGFDLPFSSIRALSRNRLIHSMAEKTFVAQCSLVKGGTWSGTVQNLRHGWSSVFCFADGSQAMTELEQRGAKQITIEDLNAFEDLQPDTLKLF